MPRTLASQLRAGSLLALLVLPGCVWIFREKRLNQFTLGPVVALNY